MVKLSKLQRLVYGAIQNYPGIQNNEASLTAVVWRISGWSDENSLEENLRKVPHPESISRRRRELHNMGLITYSSEANKVREEAFVKERQRAGAPRFINDCGA